MFRQSIDKTVLFDPKLKSDFDKLFGVVIENGEGLGEDCEPEWVADATFPSSLRALLADRVSDEKWFIFGGYNKEEKSKDAAGKLSVVHIDKVDDKDIDTWVEEVQKKFDGAKNECSITEFFRKIAPVACFIDEDKRESVLVLGDHNLVTYHCVQCAIPVIIPWLFKEKPLTEEEYKLLSSFRNPSSSEFENAMKVISDSNTFRKKIAFRTARNFVLSNRNNSLKAAKEEVRRLRQSVEDRALSLATANATLRNAEVALTGLMLQGEQNKTADDFAEYLSKNENVKITPLGDSVVRVTCFGHGDYYDEEMAERVIDNPDSYLYDIETDLDVEDMRKAFRAIFVDKELRIRLCSSYDINAGGCYVGGVAACDDVDGYMYNPHIQEYQCLGDYSALMSEALRKGDYVGVIDLCVTSCCSLNFADSVVMEKFSEWLVEDDTKCIEFPDGTVGSFEDAVIFVRGKGNE